MHNIYPPPAEEKNYKITYPVAEYDHDEGDAIAGGLEYWGSNLPQLKGKFLFGDIVRGRLFYIEMKDIKAGSLAQIKNGVYQLTVRSKHSKSCAGVGEGG